MSDPFSSSASRALAKNHADHEPQRGPTNRDISQSWKRIFSCPSMDLSGKCLDITPYATPGRYRLLSLENLRSHGDFEIFEFEELPQAASPPPDAPKDLSVAGYIAISYVWRGLPVDNDLPASQRAAMGGNFIVKGGEDADPISISVIEDIAWADGSLNGNGGSELLDAPTDLLWIDQLCIMQTSDEDKAFQISRMYGIYHHSYCLVLPGGLTRLISPEDTNNWMSRGWTLQEFLAPFRGYVAFLCMADQEIHRIFKEQHRNMTVKPFGEDAFITCIPLLEFTSSNNWTKRPPAFGFTSMGLEELSRGSRKWDWVSESTESDIWRSNWSRTSSRPVDMVFSVMQCFGVTLDPKSFRKTERVRATIALAKAILEKPKGRANWIDALWFLPPAPELSIFPQFPKTTVDGRGAVMQLSDGTTKDVIELMKPSKEIATFENVSEEHVSLFSARPTMDDDGYYTFIASEVYMLRKADESQKRVLHAGDGSTWVLVENVPDLEYRNAHPDELEDDDSDGAGPDDNDDDGDDDDSIWSEDSKADPKEEYLPNLQDIEGDVLAVLLFCDSELKKWAYMLLRKHGPRKYHRFTHLIVDGRKYDPFRRKLDVAREDVRISVGPFPGHNDWAFDMSRFFRACL